MNKLDPDKLLYLVRAIVGKHANLNDQDFEDCVSTCCVKAIEALEHIEESRSDSEVFSYVYNTIRNTMLNFIRDLATDKHDFTGAMDTYEDEVVDTERVDLIRVMLEDMHTVLSPKQRCILIHTFGLYDLEPDTRETAKRLMCSRANIYKRKDAAIRRLRKGKLKEVVDVRS